MYLSGSYLDGENRVSKMKIALSRQTLNMSNNKNVPYFFFLVGHCLFVRSLTPRGVTVGQASTSSQQPGLLISFSIISYANRQLRNGSQCDK